MSEVDRLNWNERYRNRDAPDRVAPLLVDVAAHLPRIGTALDVAGGSGRNAIWLASRGLTVTMVDVSDEAIAIATNRARNAGVTLDARLHDLDAGLPAGPWDLIVCLHYLSRPLFAQMQSQLAPGGVVVINLATTRNLEANERPPLPYLLEEGEAATLFPTLETLEYTEDWTGDGRHEARLVARKRRP